MAHSHRLLLTFPSSSPSTLPVSSLKGVVRVRTSFNGISTRGASVSLKEQRRTQAQNSSPLFLSSNSPSFSSLPKIFSRHLSSGPVRRVGNVISFPLTDVGEGIAEVEILKWYVKEGDSIHEFDKVCEVQSDKANVEITSRYHGKVTKVYYQQGEMAKVGLPLIDVDMGGDAASVAPTSPSPSPSASASTPAPTPSVSVSVSVSASPPSTSYEAAEVLATPAVRFLAKEKQIDLSKVKGTGRGGRITKEDVLLFISSPACASASAPSPSPPQVAAAVSQSAASFPPSSPSPSAPSTPSSSGEEEVVPIRGFSRAMVKTMTAAVQIPLFHYSDEILVDRLITLRNEIKDKAEEEGAKLTFMPFFLKAASVALRTYPILNSSISSNLNEVILKKSHNIGVAMATPTGLVVPNIKNVQSKSILQIAKELNNLQALAKENKLGAEHLTGGTFTLSNIGTIGGTFAVPVVSPPEVAIGAIGKVQKLPRFDAAGQVVAANLFTITWSADHRVIDGATMARFSNLWKEYLENPNFLLMSV